MNMQRMGGSSIKSDLRRLLAALKMKQKLKFVPMPMK